MSTSPSRPLLLPRNRRLRHLQGLFIRNLTLSRPRGHTIDDAALLSLKPSLTIPLAESNANRKEGALHHAHSSSELRPNLKARRRSTNWASKDMGSRQKRLEDVMAGGLVDAWFVLCVRGDGGEEDVVYISEVLERVMNPGFREFDLKGEGRNVTAKSEVIVRVYVRRKSEDAWVCLLEEMMRLERLRWMGNKLENCVFGRNAVVMKLEDGFYAMDADIESGGQKIEKVRDGGTLTETSSYSALMRLSNLDESIQDALATRDELARQINKILEQRPTDLSEQAGEDVKLANRYVAAERKMLKASIRRRAELKASIEARSTAIKKGNEVQAKVMEDIHNAQDKLSKCRKLLTTTTSEIHGQRRRICEELLAIYPIEPTSHTLLFTICGLPLQNSTFEDADEDVVSAALGYVARVADMLQYYLSVPLPYPISPYGSRSIIQDTISILQDNQRTFPLYMKGTVRFRFDYGVFLLNKNIECLAESQGLKVMDIRQTLPNLKYLLYVCSAGSSELPARKAGGIRGLLSGRGMEISSRRGSADSGVAQDVARRALEIGVEGKGRLFGGGGGVDGESLLSVPFGGKQVRSLRTSGLRENVR